MDRKNRLQSAKSGMRGVENSANESFGIRIEAHSLMSKQEINPID